MPWTTWLSKLRRCSLFRARIVDGRSTQIAYRCTREAVGLIIPSRCPKTLILRGLGLEGRARREGVIMAGARHPPESQKLLCVSYVAENLVVNLSVFMNPNVWKSGSLKIADYQSICEDHLLLNQAYFPVCLGGKTSNAGTRWHMKQLKNSWFPAETVAGHFYQKG